MLRSRVGHHKPQCNTRWKWDGCSRFSICLSPNSVYLCCCGISTLHSVRCVSSALCDCRICCSILTQLLTAHISIRIHHRSCAFMASHKVPTISIVESDTVVRSPATSSAHQSTDQVPVHQANCTKSIKIDPFEQSRGIKDHPVQGRHLQLGSVVLFIFCSY
jgi:hypothetical protein